MSAGGRAAHARALGAWGAPTPVRRNQTSGGGWGRRRRPALRQIALCIVRMLNSFVPIVRRGPANDTNVSARVFGPPFINEITCILAPGAGASGPGAGVICAARARSARARVKPTTMHLDAAADRSPNNGARAAGAANIISRVSRRPTTIKHVARAPIVRISMLTGARGRRGPRINSFGSIAAPARAHAALCSRPAGPRVARRRGSNAEVQTHSDARHSAGRPQMTHLAVLLSH